MVNNDIKVGDLVVICDRHGDDVRLAKLEVTEQNVEKIEALIKELTT